MFCSRESSTVFTKKKEREKKKQKPISICSFSAIGMFDIEKYDYLLTDMALHLDMKCVIVCS